MHPVFNGTFVKANKTEEKSSLFLKASPFFHQKFTWVLVMRDFKFLTSFHMH